MPYIPQQDRPQFDEHIDKMMALVTAKGQVTYIVTRIYHLYLRKLVKAAGKLRYTLLSEIYGMMNDSTTEFYEAVMLKYEKKQRANNGPVSEFDESII